MPEIEPSADEVRAALDELLGWQGISRSPQLGELLRYVVEKKLAGDDASIKAYSIAVDVFGRSQSFDPQADPIVRVQARRLRAVLEQFYALGTAAGPVQIHLPLGRYVPEFRFRASDRLPAAPSIAAAGPPTLPFSGGVTTAAFAIGFTLAGVALAVVLIRWALPGASPVPPVAMPDVPRLAIGTFDNLTGDRSLDADMEKLQTGIATGLSRFDSVSIGGVSAPGLVLTGAVQKSGEHFSVRAILTNAAAGGIVWSTTVALAPATNDASTFDEAADMLVPQLGSWQGPLHAPGRAWLAQQAKFPATPNLYVCELQYATWRDGRRAGDADKASGCLQNILAREPANGLALAASAGVDAWRIEQAALPGEELAAKLTAQTLAAARAVELLPKSSFVYEQQGMVLAGQGSVDAAFGALREAVELNPANCDAMAAYGALLMLDGQWTVGSALSEEALAAQPSPPPFYYAARAFNALREARYFDAVEAAQALAAADDELGPVIALAAAPQVGRSDLVDRYRAVILGDPKFQASGILPRLTGRLRQQILIDRIHDGLVLAGIPPNALVAPFNPDGTARN